MIFHLNYLTDDFLKYADKRIQCVIIYNKTMYTYTYKNTINRIVLNTMSLVSITRVVLRYVSQFNECVFDKML